MDASEGDLRELGVDDGYLGTHLQKNGASIGGTGRDCHSTSLTTALILMLGWKRLIVRSDSEPSLLALLARDAMNLVGVEM